MKQLAGASLLVRAMAFAAHKHKDQRRKDAMASPYVNHPIALADILANEAGVTDERILSAALLHDTVEDTQTSEAEIRDHFGEEIALMVMEVTDDTRLSGPERKQAQVAHAASLSSGAKAVKLADKIANLRDMKRCPPTGWTLQRRQAYFDWAKQVIDALRGEHPSLERLFDEVFLERPRR